MNTFTYTFDDVIIVFRVRGYPKRMLDIACALASALRGEPWSIPPDEDDD